MKYHSSVTYKMEAVPIGSMVTRSV